MLREGRKIFPTVTLLSPIDGTVTVRHVAPASGSSRRAAVFTIANLEPLWVNIQVPAARLANLKVGATRDLAGARRAAARSSASAAPSMPTPNRPSRSRRSIPTTARCGPASRSAYRSTSSGRGERMDSAAAAVVRHRDRSWTFVRSKDGFKARPVQVVAENAARRVDPRRVRARRSGGGARHPCAARDARRSRQGLAEADARH